MRHLKITAALVAALFLSGCASLQGKIPSASQVDNAMKSVQSLTVALCGFLPTVEGITQIISVIHPAAIPASDVAGAAAEAICKAVTSNPSPTARVKPAYGKVVNMSRFMAFKKAHH